MSPSARRHRGGCIPDGAASQKTEERYEQTIHAGQRRMHHGCRLYWAWALDGCAWIRHGARRKGEPPQLWNGLIMEDTEEYRMGVSIPALCTFMRCYFPMGQPRDNGSSNYAFWGGWANCTCEMLWRGDGINIAYSFNGGLEDKDSSALEVELHQALNQLIEDKRLRLPR